MSDVIKSFIVTVMINKKKQNRIIKATDSLSARCLLYEQLYKKDKIKEFTIIDAKERKGRTDE